MAGDHRIQRRARRDRFKVVVAVAVPVAVAASAIVLTAPDGGESNRADRAAVSTSTTIVVPELRAWRIELDDAIRPIANDLPNIIQSRPAWQENPDDANAAAAFRDSLHRALSRFAAARDAVDGLSEAPEEPLAKERFLASARLYVEFIRIERVAVDLPSGALALQVDLLARRTRIVADRIYDRGLLAIDPGARLQDRPGVEVRLAPEVPDWAAEGLEFGAPLGAAGPAPTGPPPEREDERPSQSEEDWVDAASGLAVPSAERLAEAIDEGDPDGLRVLAGELTAAAAALWALPDPDGDRERSALSSLSLLLLEGAARAAQAASLTDDPELAARLDRVARRLALVSDDLWDSALPDRASLFDASLLEGAAL